MKFLILATVTGIALAAMADDVPKRQAPSVGMFVVATPTDSTVTISGCCTIHADGSIDLRDGLTLDEQGKAFWATMAQIGLRKCREPEGAKQ